MKIGPFEILETLGGGGSGTVYKARHETLGRVVAVKQLHRHVSEGDRTFERFRREAQMMAAIRSDHVVTLYLVPGPRRQAVARDGVPREREP